jgi:DNA-binding NtrC family response regulator
MLVDDEENILKAIKRVLMRHASEWEIETYNDPTNALNRARSTVFDVFISDYRMPEMNGVDFLKEIKELQPDSMRIILTGFAELEAIIEAINEAGIFRFLTKPWNDKDLVSVVDQAIKFRSIFQENKFLAAQLREQQYENEKLIANNQ